MGNIKDEIILASRNLNVSVRELPILTIAELVDNVSGKFAKGIKGRWLWENLVDDVCVSNKDAWRWLKEFIESSETIMFFNSSEEKSGFVFKDGNSVESILGETYAFEFYLTNNELSYLLCFNHHDVLIACGTATEWLKKYKIPEFDNCLTRE